MAKPEVQDLLLQILQLKAQASKLTYEVILQKQNWFQRNSSYIISGFTICASFLLSYLGARWAFKSQVKLEDKKKEKDLEFKIIDVEHKKNEELRRCYSESSKYQLGILTSSLASTNLLISISGLGKKLLLVQDDESNVNFLIKHIESQSNIYLDFNKQYASDLKNYISALSSYKIIKNGNTKLNLHIDKMLDGINFEVNENDLSKLKTIEEIDDFMKSEKKRFKQFWLNEIKKETISGLDIILKNE